MYNFQKGKNKKLLMEYEKYNSKSFIIYRISATEW
jgi:hypothetical protein